MPSTVINGIIYTSVSDNESIVGTDEETVDSNAVSGDFNPFLRFPETVEIEGKTYLVTAVGNRAFRNCKLIKTIRIHRYIKQIKFQCFDWCINCYRITFDKYSNLESLWDGAFVGGLYTEIIIPKSVKEFGYRCFAYASKLKTLTYMRTTNPNVSSDLFYKTVEPSKIYVGLDYPYSLFHNISVAKIPNINDKVCTNNICQKHHYFVFIMLFFFLLLWMLFICI